MGSSPTGATETNTTTCEAWPMPTVSYLPCPVARCHTLRPDDRVTCDRCWRLLTAHPTYPGDIFAAYLAVSTAEPWEREVAETTAANVLTPILKKLGRVLRLVRGGKFPREAWEMVEYAAELAGRVVREM